MKIALFGGSFNPVHNGHIKAAELVLKHTDCKEVWFLPCHLHPFKKNKDFAPERERIEMLKIALKNMKRMRLSLFEIELGKKTGRESRTIETVKEIKKKFPKHEFFWVIGSDLVREIKKWGSFEKLVREIRFVVVPVKGQKGWRKEAWLKQNNAIVLPQSTAVENISSRKIREKIRKGKTIAGLLPENVTEYILKKGLYFEKKQFSLKVFRLTMLVPKGKVSTYGEIAKALEKPKSSRAVGNCLNKNPFAPIVPCHRIVKSDSSLGGFFEGLKKKKKLLESEGIRLKNCKIENCNKLIVKAERLRKPTFSHK
ncbi:MAG: nicotinate (nicotinamide) nucleotide adenylyltransferase [Candidatus Diapherotrites archaeon]